MYKKYKNYLISFFLSVFLIVFIFLFLGDFIIKNFKLNKMPYETYQTRNWFEYKKAAAKNKSYCQKIIFLGGSNVLFGINAKDIENSLQIPTVNFGIHAGFGNLIFEESKEIIRDGDIVILPLEIDYYFKEWQTNYINDCIASYVISFRKDLYKKLNLSNKMYCIRFLYCKYLFLRKPSQIKNKENDPYSTKAWNDSGDIILKREQKDNFTAARQYRVLSEEDFKAVLVPNSQIKRFLKYLKNKNVKIYFMAPVLIESKESKLNTIALEEIFSKLNTNYFKNIEENIYPINYFYDTDYHLTSFAAQKRTEQIIKQLKTMNLK